MHSVDSDFYTRGSVFTEKQEAQMATLALAVPEI